MTVEQAEQRGAVHLSMGLQIGTLVWWRKITGEVHIGRLKEYDNGTAIVESEGKEVAVRAS